MHRLFQYAFHLFHFHANHCCLKLLLCRMWYLFHITQSNNAELSYTNFSWQSPTAVVCKHITNKLFHPAGAMDINKFDLMYKWSNSKLRKPYTETQPNSLLYSQKHIFIQGCTGQGLRDNLQRYELSPQDWDPICCNLHTTNVKMCQCCRIYHRVFDSTAKYMLNIYSSIL